MTAKSRCEICNTRPIMTDAQKRASGVSFPYCLPCLTEAEWENTHSDYGHDEDSETIVPAGDDENNHRVEGCWICFPELNETTKPYKERTGTSRLGIVMHVSPRITGQDKAKQVTPQLPEGFKGTTRTTKGVTTMKGESENGASFKITWDFGSGHLIGAWTTIEEKTLKARNVAEVLRRLAEAE